MISRREFIQMGIAAGTLIGAGSSWTRLAAQQALTQDDLLQFDPLGNVTLLHITDCHAQLMPVYFREPTVNIGVGDFAGLPPHVTGKAFLQKYGIDPGTSGAYALTDQDFSALARTYGRVGGMDRLATLIKAIRAERPGKTLFFDGGDTWQGSLTSYRTRGEDMVRVMNALGTDAMTAHWEFTYGTDRVEELVSQLDFGFIAGNVVDTEWEEPVFEATTTFERGGAKIAVIGQAFPYTPVANPRYMIPDWSFGIREALVQERVDAARADGADLVVLLSHNGFDVDRKLASRVNGIDIVLTGHTHDALPAAVKVNRTLLIASGSHGKFLSRLDLDVRDGEMKGYRYKLIPVFSDVITPDPEMTDLITEIRAPYKAELETVLGQTGSTLYRRGNLNGTFDDVICDALMEQRDAEIALSPGFRWGASLLPGQDITVEDVHNMTSITYPATYRTPMSGELLKTILEDVADNLFNPDPYYQQGGDMVRVGGMGFTIDPAQEIGSRIGDMTLLRTGAPIDPKREYAVAGWASVNEGTEGPPIWDIVGAHIQAHGTVTAEPHDNVRLVGG
ncbi:MULTISPECIES: thiosulfohydrolase SoxB [unclassified Minwuia]|jgi:S-sulfosulfanyl-L-cysteine sulfohydrolase|uniref:thiosulfohydrolase SoxB n=1 Tax=unclassified Minwuia TaxID=2618799 RepID=UPI00247A1DD2|nr:MULTISPECIES: thiosulfohydrolase SoxB [unclassified Minwuia]MDF1730741.1 thiosulfohydrolase SoxB [Minwuia sp.]